MRIVFWNINNKDLLSVVCDLANDTEADVIILNETNASIEQTLKTLQEAVGSTFVAVKSNSTDRFHCFCRNQEITLGEVHKGFRTNYQEFKFGNDSAIIGMVHGVDIRNNGPEHRQSFAERLGEEVRFVRTQQDNNRIAIIGDFNMNPYDTGMNLARGLNAMMAKSCAKRRHRGYQNEKYEMYYNPMWSLLGDNSSGPPGTVYDMSNQGPYGWSMLDQVVINYSLITRFSGVEILTKAGETDLLDRNGRPNKKKLSDHLPILVTFDGETR